MCERWCSDGNLSFDVDVEVQLVEFVMIFQGASEFNVSLGALMSAESRWKLHIQVVV